MAILAAAQTIDSIPISRVIEGEKLARQHCVGCHLFPEPELLDRKTWENETLQRMRLRMGMAPRDLERHPESKLLKSSGVIPESPLMTDEDYRTVGQYYLSRAPEIALPQSAHPEITRGLAKFKVEMVPFRHEPPATTLVHISQPTRRIFLADAEAKRLNVLDGLGQPVDSIALDNVPVHATETARGLYLTLIGNFMPSDQPQGALAFLRRTEKSFEPAKSILEKTPRFTHTAFADLNGDRKNDFVACFFGNFSGKLAWFENQGRDEFRERVLIDRPGALRTELRDFDGNGTLDIAVLMAQAMESLLILFNDGKGQFRTETVFQHPPAYGHTHFESADFNGDGRLDFLVTNGDNGEYASPLKRYHGVRIYLNRGASKFEEAYLFPLNGAYKAMARDFDQDGDLDIAAISFFPDYAKSPQESFVYLENSGNLQFKPSTFQECTSGRWLTMDAGDLDGDGDVDLALGSFIRGPSDVPEQLALKWEESGPSLVILRNTLR